MLDVRSMRTHLLTSYGIFAMLRESTKLRNMGIDGSVDTLSSENILPSINVYNFFGFKTKLVS